jgi:4-deoxy-L-threo-5-hexosulose-uronate ketol-isomerase
MEIRFQHSPEETARMGTKDLRKHFLIENLLRPDELTMVYSHYDRMIIGGAQPVSKALTLPKEEELKAEYFLQRRELGIINVGGEGIVEADGTTYHMAKQDCVYLGKGTKSVTFKSKSADQPALLYLLSAPAHQTYPNMHYTKEQASPTKTGDKLTANERIIYKYIHEQGIQSAQLVMGLTILAPGSVWNTMPAHVHTRRMEAYFYFDLNTDQRVMHFMGEPSESRHIVVSTNQALISPPWSIHSGCGTSNYAFIWGMAGENYTYTDMDPVPLSQLL